MINILRKENFTQFNALKSLVRSLEIQILQLVEISLQSTKHPSSSFDQQ